MKKLISFLACVLLATSAMAGSFSRGGGSFSRSFSSPSPARSIGMSRPSVAPSYSRPAAPPSYTPPRPTTTPSYSAPATTVTHSTSGGSGGGFWSSFGGAAAGSLVGQAIGGGIGHGGGTTVVNAGGSGAVPVASTGAVVAGAAPVVVAASPGPSVASILASVLLWLILAGAIALLVWFMVRVYKAARQERMQESPTSLPFSPVSRFLEVQRAFAAKDVAALRALLGPDLIDQTLADLPEEATTPKLTGISYTVADVSDGVVSVHFTADDLMDNTKLDEVWHFTRVGGSWVLNGIDV